MAVVFSNNAKTTLASNVSTSATSITVADGSVFPALNGSDYTYVTLEDGSGNVEIVKVTALSSNALTVVRAQDNTSARAFSSGDKCELRLTAAGLNEVASQADTDTNTTYSVGDGGLTQINFTSADNTKLDGIAVNANNYTLPFTDNSTNWNTAYTYSQVGHLPLAGGTLTGNLLINSANAEVNLRSGVAGTSGAVNWTFNTNGTNYASIKLPYDTRASTGLHIDSGYPITIDTSSSTGIKFVVNAANKATINSSGLTVSGTVSATGGNSANWNTAYGWGNHASAGYVSTTGNQNIDGIKIFTGTNVTLDNPVNSWKYIRLQSAASAKWDIATNEADTSGALQFRPLGSGANAAYVTTSGNYVSVPQGTLWGSSNDGSGSGLDADLLDGQQGDSYLRRDIPSIISVASSSADLLRLANSTSGQFIQIGFQQNDTDGMHHRAYLKAWKGSATASGNVDLIVRGSAGSLTSDVLSLRSGNASPTWRGQAIWNAGNDGAASGLDADLLDGVQGASFLRSDADDSFSGNLTTGANNHLTFGPNGTWGSSLRIGGNGRTATGTEMASIVTTDGNIHLDAANSANGIYLNYYAGTNGVFFGNGATSTTARMQSNGQLYKSGGTTNPYWNSTNDGSGSGLDADLLDGQQGSYYNQSQFTGSAFTSRNSGNAIAIDSVTTNMVGYVNSSTAAGYADGAGFSAAYSSSWVGQLFVDFRTGKLSSRGKNNGTWQTHRFMWDNLNDGSGSGLDADLLDGSQGQYYKHPTSPMSQNVSFDSFSGVSSYYNSVQFMNIYTPSAGTQATYNSPTNVGSHHHVMQFNGYSPTINNWKYQSAYSFYTGDMYTRNMYSSTWAAWRKQWDSVNDGSGSGLDADLLDGQQGSYYAPASHGHSYLPLTGGALTGNLNGTTAAFSGKVDFQGHAAIEGGNGYGVFKGYTGNNNHFIVVRGSVANQTGLSITGGHQTTFVEHAENNDTSGWYFKSNQTGSYAEIARITRTGGMHLQGNKVWHAGNDASGSGLDADSVDGIEGANIVRNNSGNQFMSGTHGTARLQLRRVDTSANMHSYLSMWASEPGITHDGCGIGGNIANAGFYYGVANTAVGTGSLMRFYQGNIEFKHLPAVTGAGNAGARTFYIDTGGNCTASGNISAYSDERLKTNIETIPSALEKVNALRGVTFDMNGVRGLGVIAQETETVIPEVVMTADDEMGTKSVAYGNMVGLLIEAIKELKSEVDDLRHQQEKFNDK